MGEITLTFPPKTEWINDSFIPMWNNKDRIKIFYGGRGSSKSHYVAGRLIHHCLLDKYFRFILVRNVYATIKNSQYQTIKDIITDWGFERYFEFNVSPLEIRCVNGNKFVAAGCDDPTKIKSIKDPTGAWYEEEIPSEEDWITITTSIRTTKGFLQEFFTINPEVEGKFEDNWFWKKFFKGHPAKSFSHSTEVKYKLHGVDRSTFLHYTTHHSTHFDNKWLPDSFRAFLQNLEQTNPYYYKIYGLGEWGNKSTGGNFYKQFSTPKHVVKDKYDPHLPLHLTFDFNVRPYLTLNLWQIFDRGSRAVQVDEIIGIEPDNRTRAVCKIFVHKYYNHTEKLFVYGDPSGIQEDTRTEQGMNDFDIISGELEIFRPIFRIDKEAPPVSGRGQWIDAVLGSNEGDLTFNFNENCTYTIMDYSYGKEAADGTKFKEKYKDDQGIQAERYHHCTDANDYFLCYVFRDQFNVYLRGKRERSYTPAQRDIPQFNQDRTKFHQERTRFRARE